MTTIHTTQAQKLAAKYAANLADRMLLTITIVSWAAKLITLGVAVVSYRHQLDTLRGWHAPAEMAYALPALFDVLTIICVLALSTPGILPTARRVAGWVITVPILLSAAINFAGHGSWMVKAAALSMPVLIPLAELVGSHIRPDFAEMDRIERAAYATATPEPVVDPAEQAVAAAEQARLDAEQTRIDDERAKRSEAAQKAAATRRTNAQRLADEKAAKAEARRQAREARKLEAKADTAQLFARIAVETDPDYVDGVAPSSAVPVA